MRHAASLVLAAFAAGGCMMVGPNYQRPASELPAAYGEPAPGNAALKVPFNWWRLYGDATLDSLVEAGLDRNADLRLAAARVEEAEAALREARATLLFPLVQGSAGAARGRTTASNFVTATGFNLGLSTSFEVDLWGRLRRSELAIADQLLASRYGRDTVALTLAATVARTYFAVRSLDAQLIASNEIVRAADESFTLARKRANAGAASGLDVYQAGALRSQAAAQATEVVRQRESLVHQLGALTGRLDLALPPGDFADLPIPPLAPPGLPSQLLERRPDVMQAEANLSAATQRIGVAKAAQLPALTLTGSVGVASKDLDRLFSTGARTWSVGAGLLGPILDAGRYKARTEQAEAQARQAQATWEKAVQTAFREVSDALSNIRRAGESEVDLRARVDQACGALRLAQERYDAGYSAYLEVLDAQRTLNDAQLALIRNRQAYLSYTVDLMNALGGGWPS